MVKRYELSTALSKSLFYNPTPEYRAVPFWAWNCFLEKDVLMHQIEIFKKMGMGGFMIHARQGLKTPYMQEAFMELVRDCIEKGKEEGMYTWLYDEDKWPSGDAGRQVTRESKYKNRVVKVTSEQLDAYPFDEAVEQGKSYLLAMYAINRNYKGQLVSYRKIEEATQANISEEVFYAYSLPAQREYYVDTLSQEAINKFIQLTHEKYKKLCGEDFGVNVPSIFTDEPQFAQKQWLGCGVDNGPVCMPWTYNLPETYKEEYGKDILATLPELIWDREDGGTARARYLYHNHITNRFVEAFSDNIGKWCRENNIALSGHLMAEQALWTQSAWTGETMRSYRSFDIPGVDMLCDFREYTTVIQARSAAHQYGRNNILSELYGVTNWDFDFKGHKLQGDWQAALGVNIRVPHLAWVSMQGDAKRDYPASIGYQSPWYEKYSIVEDHFARVNTAMTRGKPVVNVAVIHPVESYWLYWGPKRENADIQCFLENNFQKIADWLLFDNIDFDYISEDSMPALYDKTGEDLKIGAIGYKAVIISGCVTLRRTTIEILLDFVRRGGKVIFVGDKPEYIDACKNNVALMDELYELSCKIEMNKESIVQALETFREIEILQEDGNRSDKYLYNLRKEGDNLWLFVANGRKQVLNVPTCGEKIRIRVKGCFDVSIYDTQTGKILPAMAEYVENENIWTQMNAVLYMHDSLLLSLTPSERKTSAPQTYNRYEAQAPTEVLEVDDICAYELSEDNEFLLDKAEYSLDGINWHPEEEMLRIDTELHKILWPDRPTRQSVQPYMVMEEKSEHTVYLRMRLHSNCTLEHCKLALEEAEKAEIYFNYQKVDSKVCGFFTDRSIKTILLPTIQNGENILEIRMPINNQSAIEWCYILGDFSVNVSGTAKTLGEKHKLVAFSDLRTQGLPFYGANITYKLGVVVPGEKGIRRRLGVNIPMFKGPLVSVCLDGEHKGDIIYDPNFMVIDDVMPGSHSLELVCYGNRYNSFGPLHMQDDKCIWFGPMCWYTQGDTWTDGYVLKESGIIGKPEIVIY